MLTIELLLAGQGDCLWIEYGDPESPRRVLIDGGVKGTYRRALHDRLRNLSDEERCFELLVVTHIDDDHIAGVLDLLADRSSEFRAKDIWFNGYRHLPDEGPETLGPVQGERLTDLLVKPGIHWNDAFGAAAVVVPAAGDLPRVELDGGLILTLLSPAPEQLANLKPEWEAIVRAEGLDPNQPRPEEVQAVEEVELLGGPPDVEDLIQEEFSEDKSEANGSSIALLAEYQGRRLLLAGDAHPTVVRDSLRRLQGGRKVEVDACKLPHHGSKANVSRPFLEALDCPTYLFSTNGARHKHPDCAAVARVIKWGGPSRQLVFNYRTKHNAMWDNPRLREAHGYTTVFPEVESAWAVLRWD